MTVTKEQLRTEVGTTAADDDLLERCLLEATEDVTTYLEDNDVVVADLEEINFDRAVRTAAADAFYLAKAPNGVANQEYDIGNGEVASSPVRIGRDPLRGARKALELYVGPAIG